MDKDKNDTSENSAVKAVFVMEGNDMTWQDRIGQDRVQISGDTIAFFVRATTC